MVKTKDKDQQPCECVNRDNQPINAEPMWHGAACPLYLKWKEGAECPA